MIILPFAKVGGGIRLDDSNCAVLHSCVSHYTFCRMMIYFPEALNNTKIGNFP